MSKKISEIKIHIELDDQRIPESITWQASDANMDKPSDSKSVFLALLDHDTLDTSTLFLWTKECQVAEMDRKIFYSLSALADGYFRATQNTGLANEMKSFVRHFGEQTGILKPDENPS